MSLDSCNCCGIPTHNVGLHIETRMVHADKCGYSDGEGGFWSTKTVNGAESTLAYNPETGDCDETIGCFATAMTEVTDYAFHEASPLTDPDGQAINAWETTVTGSTTVVTTISFDCSESVTCSGTVTVVYVFKMVVSAEGAREYVTTTDTHSFGIEEGACMDTCTATQVSPGGTISVDCSLGYAPTESTEEDPNPVVTYDPPVPTETTYGGEPALPDLPEYAGPWDSMPTVGWGEAFNGNFAAGKFQWRMRHSPTATCYLKVWLRKTTIIEADPEADPPVLASTTHDDSYAAYEWHGTGNPCFADPDLTYYHDDNRVFGSETEVGVPTKGETIQVSILKWSCVEGYEPDISDSENPQPNGFPDPAWEATPP